MQPTTPPTLVSRNVAFLLGAIATLICAHVLFLRSVTQGIGLAVDFMPYTLPVHDLLNGNPFMMIHHPPLYSLAIFVVARIGQVDPFAAAQLVQWACYLTLPLIAGWMIWRLTPGSTLPALFVMVTLATSPYVLDLGAQIASEHLFGVFNLVALAALIFHLTGARSAIWWWTSAVATALAVLTRYAGVGLVVALGLLLLVQRKAWSQRWRETAITSAIALTPLALYVLWNYLRSGQTVNREFSFKGVPWHKLDHGLHVMTTWWAPQPLVTRPLALLTIGLVALAWFAFARQGARSKEPWQNHCAIALRVLGIFSGIYLAFIFACMIFADAWIPFDHRILFPVQLAATAATALAAAMIAPRSAAGRLAVGLILLALMLLNVRRGWLMSADYAEKGIGYATLVSDHTPWAEQIRHLPSTALIISNRPELVYCYTQRTVTGLPATFDFLNGRPARDLETAVTSLGRQVEQAPDTFFIQFNESNLDTIPVEKIFKRTPFHLILRSAQGTLWHHSPSSQL